MPINTLEMESTRYSRDSLHLKNAKREGTGLEFIAHPHTIMRWFICRGVYFSTAVQRVVLVRDSRIRRWLKKTAQFNNALDYHWWYNSLIRMVFFSLLIINIFFCIIVCVVVLFKMKLFFWLEELKMFLLLSCRTKRVGPKNAYLPRRSVAYSSERRRRPTGRGRRRQTDNRDAFNRDAFNRDAFSIIFHVHSVKNGSAAVFVYILGALLCVFEPQLIVLWTLTSLIDWRQWPNTTKHKQQIKNNKNNTV